MVSTRLKNISQNGNLPQVGVKIKIFETTIQVYIFLHLLNFYGNMVGKYTIPMDGMGYMFHPFCTFSPDDFFQCPPRSHPRPRKGARSRSLEVGFLFYPFCLVCWKSNFHLTLISDSHGHLAIYRGYKNYQPKQCIVEIGKSLKITISCVFFDSTQNG